MVWIVDAAYWWVRPERYAQRGAWLEAVVQFFFLFMFFNATVVFGLTQAVRVYGLVLCVVAGVSVGNIFRRKG
jgi:hypothetical protein